MTLSERIRACKACPLHLTRKNVVVGRGSKNPEVLFVGECPGPSEDMTGQPFIGVSGQLLKTWISALDIKDYALTNVVKCFPGKVRPPSDEEVDKCKHWLDEQITELDPKYIVAVGKFAMNYFLPEKISVMKEAGKVYNWKGVKVFVFIHPSYFLRSNNNIDWRPMLNGLYKTLHGKDMEPRHKTKLIYDIETTSLEPEVGKIKCVAFYSYKYNKASVTTDLKKAYDYINEHDVIIGYNNHEFDDVWIEKHCGKIKPKSLDLFYIIKKKQPIMKVKFKNFKLDTVCKVLGLGEKKKIDDKVLFAEHNTPEEMQMIKDYCEHDVVITKKLFDWLDDKNVPLKEFLPFESKHNYGHLTLPSAPYGYKVICHLTGLKEEYFYDNKKETKQYEGGYVMTPTVGELKGNIYCLDMTSLYPHILIMQNLFSKGGGYTGNKINKLKGNYKTDKMGKVEEVLLMLLKLKIKYKKEKDPREYAIKIIINSVYGCTGSKKFVSLYDLTTAADCTSTGRDWIKYARDVFLSEGYNVIYGDSDSLFIEDVFNDEKKLLGIKDRIINEIKSQVPFPVDTFDMGIDDRIKGIFFFDDKKGEYKKKNYIYITQDDRMVIKGLPVIKRNSSKLSRVILETLKPDMIKNNDIGHSHKQLERLITDEIKKDISVLRTEYNITPPYKSDTCIQMEILKKYGEGTHYLIKNKKIGVGKGVKYCTIDEAADLETGDLDITRVWHELKPFIKKQKGLFEWSSC